MILNEFIVNQLNAPAKIFRYLLISFVIGVALASFVSFNLFDIYFAFFTALILAIIFWRKKYWRYVFIAGLFLIIGIWRYQLSLPETDQAKIWFYNEQKINFEGIVAEEPDTRINKTKLIIETNHLVKQNQVVSGKVLINASLYPEYEYGDVLAITCKLAAPEVFNGFAYDRYLAKDDIYSTCSYPAIRLLDRGKGDWFSAKIFRFKNSISETVNKNLPEPAASLFFAINFGSRGGIPQSLSDTFSATGTTHLIAISGMNITIIAAVITNLFLSLYISRKKAFWLTSSVLLFYIVLIGWPASAVRAAIMGWLGILAIYVGRKSKITNALILTAALMILINPKILRDDAGFQLSFLALIGLIYCMPFWEARLKKLPKTFGLSESLAMTLAAQTTTTPLILYNFGRLSLIAPIANLFVVPTMLYLMIIGFFSIFFSYALSEFSQYFFWPTWLLTEYLIKAVGFFSALPYAALTFK